MSFEDNLVTIIMPVYNAEKYLKAAIDSVLNQTYSNIELLIVDDCSTDSSSEIYQQYDKEPKVHATKLMKNIGVAGARNIGIKSARGRFIGFLDSDDLFHPNKLQYQIDLLTETGLGCCHTYYNRVNGAGDVLGTVQSKKLVSRRNMFCCNHIGNLTGLYDTKYINKVYQKSCHHEDYIMWLEILKYTDSIAVDRVLASYRVLEQSLSSNKFKSAKWQ